MEKKLSDMISKDVVTISNGQKIGYLLGACFDENLNKLLGFAVVDDESEQERFLSYKDILLWGEDSVFVQDQFVLSMQIQSNSPIGKKVYDQKGNLLGRVRDVVLCNDRAQNLLLSACSLPAKAISVCGVDCLFFGIKIRKKCKKMQKFDKNYANLLPKVQIESDFNISKNQFSIGQTKKLENPKKIILAPVSLLNKHATADIFGMNNELLIKNGQQITQSKIESVKKHGKLNLLIINSK